MPWKVCEPMDGRLRFIARRPDGEKMAGLCREFGVRHCRGKHQAKRDDGKKGSDRWPHPKRA